MIEIMPDWKEIFMETDFGDKRRNKRAIKIANEIENSFERSASASMPDQAALKATSRFMSTEYIKPETIIDKFIENNYMNIRHEHVLIAQDTTEMNFAWRNKKLKGLGPVGNGEDQGFFLHPGIIIEPDKEVVLGLAAANFIVRDFDSITKRQGDYKSQPIEQKESYKWLLLPQEVREKVTEDVKMTVVADRESDIFDLFYQWKIGKLGENIELLIRACRDRKIVGEEMCFFDTIAGWPVKGEYEIHVNPGPKRTRRTAKLEVRYGNITIEIPKTQSKKEKSPVPNINVIDVREIEPPEGESPIHWTLLTTWSVNSMETALEKVRWYSCRWYIEELFRVLKSGYKVEKVQFDTGNALMNWCAMRLMMAVKILHLLTQRDVESPDSALPYFSSEEIKILEYTEKTMISPRSKIHRPQSKSIAWTVLIIAVMGGYKATPSAGPPGQECLWRGLIRLDAALVGYKAAKDKSG